MRLTLLGSGNAAGMPVYGCDCMQCTRAINDKSYRRETACALLESGNSSYLLDAGLMGIHDRFPPGHLAGIFLTHFHADHVQGLFELRWGKKIKIPVYCPPDSQGCDDLFKHPGILDFITLKKFKSFQLGDVRVTPLPLIHSKVTFGYVFEKGSQRVAYLTDTKGLPPRSMKYLADNPLDTLVIDTSFPPAIQTPGHNNLNDTLAIHQQLNPKQTVLTHIGHQLDGWLSEYHDHLPDAVMAGRDGLVVFPG
ncbi:MAG: phosphonate metabolism protein PhnP [Thioalkalispiraceae bacterium]|jgi:phosphoribosyl 1,2-cyclic phosphate phosphodiesterase